MSSEPRSRSYGRWALAWAPVGAWAALIFLASAQSDLVFVPDATLDLIVRKLGHAAVFGILALLLWRAFAMTTRVRRPWAWALALAILYAISDEVHQGGVSGRYPSPVDVAIDAAGALFAVAIVGSVLRRRRTVDG
jgi:VanZ family protein